MKLKALLFTILCLFINTLQTAKAQSDSSKILLSDIVLQSEITEGLDHMYNFEFDYAESQYRYIQSQYPDHPLPMFLLGLAEWWKIFSNLQDKSHDARFHALMDSSIYMAKKLYKGNKTNPEATFFLSAANSLKARVHSERSQWTSAALYTKRSLKYLDKNNEYLDLSPEFKFGEGIYNFYAVWIKENYPALKPVLILFKKGDKDLGLEQLEETAALAFYTRIEAIVFLIMIYTDEDDQLPNALGKALNHAEYMHEHYPNNPFFHRYYARILYKKGMYGKLKSISKDLLDKVDKGMYGYVGDCERYASFYLGAVLMSHHKTRLESIDYFKRSIKASEEQDKLKSGYYHWALAYLARIEKGRKNYDLAYEYYDKLVRKVKHKHTLYKEGIKFRRAYKRGQLKK